MVSVTPRLHFTRERPGTQCTVGWVGPRAVLDKCGKSRPHRNSIPNRPARSSVAIPTELPVPNLSQIDPVYTSTSHFLKAHVNITLPSKPGFPKWSLSFRFPHQHPVYTSPLPHTLYMPRPYNSQFYYTNNIR